MKVVLVPVSAVLLVCLGQLGVAEPPAKQAGKGAAPAKQKPPDQDRLNGMQAALTDLQAGKLKQKSFPIPPPPWHGQYLELLKEECGVEWETLKGQANLKRITELGGYNDVMRAEIEHRFGRGIFDKLEKKAEAEFRNPKKKP